MNGLCFKLEEGKKEIQVFVKRFLVFLCVVGLFFGMVDLAKAIPFQERHDYSGDGVYLGEDYIAVADVGNTVDYYDTFVLSGFGPADDINEAYFSFTHVGNVSTILRPELWLISEVGSGMQIGLLSESPCGSWTTDTFALSDEVIDLITASNPWQLALVLSEETGGIDALRVDEASLYGDYEPSSPPSLPALMAIDMSQYEPSVSLHSASSRVTSAEIFRLFLNSLTNPESIKSRTRASTLPSNTSIRRLFWFFVAPLVLKLVVEFAL